MKKDFVSDALRSGLGKRLNKTARVLLWLLAGAVFFVFARYARYAMIDEFSGYRMAELQIMTAGVYTAIFAVSFGVQLAAGKKLPAYVHILLALITGLVLLGKISLLDYVSDDYDIFLSNWIYDYSLMDLKTALGRYIASDYSPPYLYLLAFISRIPSYPWQYLVKAISIAFEVLLAYGVMKLCSLKVRGEGAQLAIFHIASLLPTVVFDGAYWGQCDVIYTSLCLMALYMGLKKRSALSMIFFGVALSFKFQTVFFLPALLPLWLRKDIKLSHLVLIPATYMVMMAPALWAGKSLHHVLTVYLQQAGNYNFITMNGPNFYQLLPDLDSTMLYNMFGSMAYMLGGAAVMAMCAVVFVKRNNLTEESALLACLMTIGGVVLLLPKMHERYMFGADVLSLVAAAYSPKLRRMALPLLYGLSSYIAYTGGLPGEKLMDLQWSGLLLIAAVALTGAELWQSLNEKQLAAAAEVKA